MLFVKDMVFLDGAMAQMAPTVDVLAEIVAVVMYFHVKHGERIAREMGLADGPIPAVDVDGIRASFGITEPVDTLTYRELQERRELIRRRMEQHQRARRRSRLAPEATAPGLTASVRSWPCSHRRPAPIPSAAAAASASRTCRWPAASTGR